MVLSSGGSKELFPAPRRYCKEGKRCHVNNTFKLTLVGTDVKTGLLIRNNLTPLVETDQGLGWDSSCALQF